MVTNVFNTIISRLLKREAYAAIFRKLLVITGFVQLKPRILSLMIFYLQCCRLGWHCGLYYADSTSIAVCHNRRIQSNKVFFGKAMRGKTSTGWFYGFKLFLVVNAFGEIIHVMFTGANIADNNIQNCCNIAASK